MQLILIGIQSNRLKSRIFFFVIFFILVSCKGTYNRDSETDNKRNNMQNNEQRFLVENGDGSSFEVIMMSNTEFNALVSSKQVVFNEDLFREFGYKTFTTVDSRIIIEESGNYAMYPSKQLLVRQLEKIRGPYSRELLYDKNPFGQEFPNHVNEMIRVFASDHHLDATPGKSLLTSIDSIANQNRNSTFFEEHYLLFIAIIGECIIAEKGGKWMMYLCDDKVTWSPFIQIKDRDLHFIHYIQEDFFNQDVENPLLNSYDDIIAIITANIEK